MATAMKGPEGNIMDNTIASPAARLFQMLNYDLTQMIYVVVKLGVPDLLADGPRPADEIASSVGVHVRSLYRLLRALASLDLFVEDSSGRFSLTPLSELLRSGIPGSLRPFALAYGEPWWWSAWGSLLYSVQTGRTAFEHVQGRSLFEFLAHDAEAAQIFNANMTAMTSEESQAVVTAYDFSRMRLLVDVGGGQGALAAAVLQNNPEARAIIFDLPSVVEQARKRLVLSGMVERYEVVGGNFFEQVPAGGDVYTLKDILHDWDDPQAVNILQACHAAMGRSARLLVIERIIRPGKDGVAGKLTDISMLVFTGGKERTEGEYRALLDSAGFLVKGIVSTGGTDIIEAVPA